MKINKFSKLVCNLHDKKTILFTQELKKSIKTWITSKKAHRVIQFNQAWHGLNPILI